MPSANPEHDVVRTVETTRLHESQSPVCPIFPTSGAYVRFQYGDAKATISIIPPRIIITIAANDALENLSKNFIVIE
jgi:hypothetical protein